MLRFAANLTFLFCERPLAERPKAAAQAGFKAIEMLDATALEADHLNGLLSDHRLQLVLFNCAIGQWDRGERGIAALPGREAEAIRNVSQACARAKTLGCKQLHVMAGLKEHGASLSVLRKNLPIMAEIAQQHDITLLLEPINALDMPGYLYDQTDTVVELIETVGFANVQLQFDLYHRQMTSGDVASALPRYLQYAGHIQIAGVPGRHEPIGITDDASTGWSVSSAVDFATLLNVIDRSDYSGWIGCEYKPLTDTVAGLSWLRPFQE